MHLLPGEGDGIMLGAFKIYQAWVVDRIPEKFSFQLLEPDWKSTEHSRVESGAFPLGELQVAKLLTARKVSRPTTISSW